jgi:hypothetical protein
VTRLGDISPDQLRAFLRGAGWEEVGTGAIGESWTHPERADAPAILVPDQRTDRDFSDLMSSAIQRLAWTTGIREDEIVERI